MSPLPQDGLSQGLVTENFRKPNFSPATPAAVEAAPAEVPQEASPKPLPTIADENRLLQPGTVVWELQPGWGHSKARTQQGKGYPERQPPPNGAQNWNQVDKSYNPVHYEAPVLAMETRVGRPAQHPGDAGQARVEELRKATVRPRGEPLNPKGPTGITGRGLLGKHGANFAAI